MDIPRSTGTVVPTCRLVVRSPAALSGRCLLQVPGRFPVLAPLRVAGPGPFGVGVGIVALEALAEASEGPK